MMPDQLAQSLDLLVHIVYYRRKQDLAITLYRNAVIIYNPSAGKLKRHGSVVERAVEILVRAGHVVTAAPTTGPGAAGLIAREKIDRGTDLILAAGGDGTINEVVQGMARSVVPLGILPVGTANVLANELGIGVNLAKAAAGIAGLVPKRIAIGRLTASEGSRYFLMMAGVGLDAHIVYNLNLPLKRRLGKVAYWIGGFSLLGRRLEEFEVRVDGDSHTCSFALVSRVRNYGGDLEIASGADLLDDQFEVVLFEGPSSSRYLKYFLGVAFKRLNGMEGVRAMPARRIILPGVKDRRIYIQVDGEYAGRLPATVEIEADALTLLVP
ncbi:MAG: diacylglycerol kinase family protein, partial [Bryobacteraceae bacterium]